MFGWSLRSLGRCVVWRPCPRPQHLCHHSTLRWPETCYRQCWAPWSWLSGDQNVSRCWPWLHWQSNAGRQGQVCVRAWLLALFSYLCVSISTLFSASLLGSGRCELAVTCLNRYFIGNRVNLFSVLTTAQCQTQLHNFKSKNGFAKDDCMFTCYHLLVRPSEGSGNGGRGAAGTSSGTARACPCLSVPRTSCPLPPELAGVLHLVPFVLTAYATQTSFL